MTHTPEEKEMAVYHLLCAVETLTKVIRQDQRGMEDAVLDASKAHQSASDIFFPSSK
jgi:hypothetical protein